MDQIKRKNYIKKIQLGIIITFGLLHFSGFAYAVNFGPANAPEAQFLPFISVEETPTSFIFKYQKICDLINPGTAQNPTLINIVDLGQFDTPDSHSFVMRPPEWGFTCQSHSHLPRIAGYFTFEKSWVAGQTTSIYFSVLYRVMPYPYDYVFYGPPWHYKFVVYFDHLTGQITPVIPPQPCSIHQHWHSCNMAGCCWRIGPEGLFPALDGCVPCSDYSQLCAEGPWSCQWCPQTECQALAGCHWNADKQFCGLGPTPCSGINLHACHTQAECEHWLGYWDAATQKCLTGPPLQPPTYTDPDFGLMGNWVRDVLKFLFMPDFDRIRRSFLTFFQTIRTRFPFAYFYQGYDIIRGIQNNPTPVLPADVAFAFYGQTVPLFSWSFFDSPTFAPIAQIMRTIITFFIWFSVFDYVIFRVKTTDVGV